MNIQIQSVKFDADKKLVAFVEEKISKLNRFSEDILSADITLKLDKDKEHGNKVAVLKLDVAGDILVAERQCKSFEEAVDLSVDALRKQLSKYKAKV
ncbi:MAG: ribosome-associated translation inhibitor RaiA [Rikenellaceae bacterium]|nr:ribosome-associated translation inhibitor RaiA [Rikenellaceae bacterium]